MWRETRHFDKATKDRTSMQILNSSFEKPIADTPVFVTERNCNFATNKQNLDQKKSPKTLFMLVFYLVLHLAFALEHRKIKIFEPRNLLRIRFRLETFEY